MYSCAGRSLVSRSIDANPEEGVRIVGGKMPHSIAIPITFGNGSFGRFAVGDCDTLLLLVHGFGGGAASTWTGLQSLANRNPATVHADIVSYGFDSTNAPLANSAVLLRTFINMLVTGDPQVFGDVSKINKETSNRKYQRIFIVAHSLGAAVARRAILDAIECGDVWPQSTQLILFAPAHMGTRLLNDEPLIANGLGGLVSGILIVWKIIHPAVDDLKKDSPFLKKLTSDTWHYLNSGWTQPLRARRVLFGEKERVVIVERFCSDPIQSVWPLHTHTSICRSKEAATFVGEAML